MQGNLHLENPVSSAMCSQCLVCGQHLHGGAQGRLVLLMGKTLVFGILETQSLVYHCRMKQTASRIKGSEQRVGWISFGDLLTHLQREGWGSFYAHSSKSGSFQGILFFIKESVPGMMVQQDQRQTKEPSNYLYTNSGCCHLDHHRGPVCKVASLGSA